MAKNQKLRSNLKSVVKSEILEIIEENEALVSSILETAIEDAFLSRAIKDGRKGRIVSRQKVFKTIAELSK
jgi:DNA gyrase/topoisomerase IV subunit B